MTDEIEKQVERAMARWTYVNGCHDVRELMRDLLAGKFKEEPLPEIAKPAIGAPVELCVFSTRTWFVRAVAYSDSDWIITGPRRDSKREAVEAWNKVFGK